jgi:phosphatidylserine/phosphatidylglycerophosphate/cardiolipin synthase-like enzyme
MDAQAGGYSGSESYRYVEPILRDSSRELLVISPYIGMGYAKMLVGLGRRKRVRVITSKYSETVRGYIGRRSRYLLYGYARAAAIFVVGAIASAYFSFYQISLGALALAGITVLAAMVAYRLSKNSDIEIRTSYDRFVHEKAYISRDAAAVGSANLTYSGMRKNVERVEVITDPARIGVLRDHFFDLWKASR